MKKNILGRTSLEVTQLGFGAMELRGPKVWDGQEVSDEESDRILNAVLEAGINFIDTSVDYGLSEERIGRYISSRRSEYYLGSKCGCDPQDKGDHIETPHVWTSENLFRNIHGSLERMKTDHVDLLQLHNPSPTDVRSGKLVEALREIQSQGMTRFVGISTTEPDLHEFLEMDVFDTFQIPYSCLEPRHDEAITQVGQAGAGVIIRGGIGQGGPDSKKQTQKNVDLWKQAKLDDLCEGMKASELILRYTLSHPYCHTTIVGTRNPAHLLDNLAAAAQGPLPSDLYNEVKQRVNKALG